MQCSALYLTTLHCMSLLCSVLYGISHLCTALHCTTVHSTAQRCTALHCAIKQLQMFWQQCKSPEMAISTLGVSNVVCHSRTGGKIHTFIQTRRYGLLRRQTSSSWWGLSVTGHGWSERHGRTDQGRKSLCVILATPGLLKIKCTQFFFLEKVLFWCEVLLKHWKGLRVGVKITVFVIYFYFNKS